MKDIASKRYQKIAEIIQAKILSAHAAGKPLESLTYRWLHTQRVGSYGKLLAEAEGGDPDLVITACLLHDIAKFDVHEYGVEHGRIGAMIAQPILQELGHTAEEIDNICYSIAVHVDNKAGFEHPATLESKIVDDADNLDRFSAYRMISSLASDALDYDKFIVSVEKQRLRLQNYNQPGFMATPAGALMFSSAIQIQFALLERLIAEKKLTHLPDL